MNRNIDRILAQEDMRNLTVAVSGQGAEVAKTYRDALIKEVGKVVKIKKKILVISEERDEQGFAELKAMAF